MFTKFIGVIIGLVLIMAFLPVILEAIGWAIAIMIGGILLITCLIMVARALRPRRSRHITYHIHRH